MGTKKLKYRKSVNDGLVKFLENTERRHSNCVPKLPASLECQSGLSRSYADVAVYMKENVHAEVVQGDLLSQLKTASSGKKIDYDQIRYLNKHGSKHVDMVIEMASLLLQELHCELSPFECYLLLMAIQFHDVGIVYGREEHEIKCLQIMNLPQLKNRFADTTLQKDILCIASVHGGVCLNGDKDTISTSIPEDVDYRYGQTIRRRFLASVVRFADELADDRTRASILRLADGTLPEASALHHYYSDSLYSVCIEDTTVRLNFQLRSDVAIRLFDKKDSKVYLLDEIYSRTKKMHQERIYCMRFWPREFQQICDIQVEIRIEFVSLSSEYLVDDKLIKYGLSEKGYPGIPIGDCRLCLKTESLPSGTEIATQISGYNDKISAMARHSETLVAN